MFSFIRRCNAAIVSFACALSCEVLLAQQQSDEPQPAADAMRAWYAFYDHEAAHAYQFKLEPGDVELSLDQTPVLRWTNPLEGGSIHGVGYIWRNSGRPIVLGQLFSYLDGKGGRVYCHAMHSLARKDEKLTGLREGKEFWTPDSPGVEMRDVPAAPAPSPRRVARLAQMKAISRRFAAYTEEATRGKRNLRLLPTPLYRFGETGSKDSDGSLFSFVVGNDPEVVLLVEQDKRSAGESVWRYGIVRSTRSNAAATLDEREVWRYDSEDKNPADSRNSYLSVHEIAILPIEAPKRPGE